MARSGSLSANGNKRDLLGPDLFFLKKKKKKKYQYFKDTIYNAKA